MKHEKSKRCIQSNDIENIACQVQSRWVETMNGKEFSAYAFQLEESMYYITDYLVQSMT